jgi:hypothetical protein
MSTSSNGLLGSHPVAASHGISIETKVVVTMTMSPAIYCVLMLSMYKEGLGSFGVMAESHQYIELSLISF